jgi:glycine hydroxymethyltransferase
VGDLIGDVLDGLKEQPEGNAAVEAEVRTKVIELCRQFPIYTS